MSNKELSECYLRFLKLNQPLPDDDELERRPHLIEELDEARKYFLSNPDFACVPLFLGAYGGANGFGVYQLIEDVFFLFPANDIVSALRAQLLNSRSKYNIYWNLQVCAYFPSDDLIDCLLDYAASPDEELRYEAVVALGSIHNPAVSDVLKKLLSIEKDVEIADFIKNKIV